jgi:hypothetical protein
VASTGPNDFQDSFSDFAIAAIGYDLIHPDAYGFEDDWSGTMQRMGIAPELIQDIRHIMDPECTSVRLTESLKRWLIHTMELRYMVQWEDKSLSHKF